MLFSSLIVFPNFVTIGYVQFLCAEYSHIIDESVESTPSLERLFIERLKISPAPVELDCRKTAELLLGRCNLSQRGFKSLRKILRQNNVSIPSYENVRKFCNETDVGMIQKLHSEEIENIQCNCMGVKTDLKETLQNIISNKYIYKRLLFLMNRNSIRYFHS